MTGKLKAKGPTTRDRIDDAKLKRAGDLAHINAIEDRLLGKLMPESHGKVTRGGLLAESGQGADDRVTLLTPKEQKLLALLGGSGTANPETGLLSFEDGDGTGTSGGGNTGMGGPSGGGMGSGSASAGPSGGSGFGGESNYSAGAGYGFTGPSGFGPNGEGLSIGDISGFGGPPGRSINGVGDMAGFASPVGALTNFGLEAGYAPLDTLKRLLQTAVFGPPKQYSINGLAVDKVPGRYGMPTGKGPGIAGTVAAMFGGPMMSGALKAGSWMEASMSPEAKEASMAHNQALGSRNSSGNENARLGHTVDALGSPLPGTAQGSGGTGGLLGDGTAVGAASTVAPGGTPAVQPGQVMDTSGRGSTNTLTGLPAPVQNLLADYLWRGRQGRGLNW